MRVEFSTSFLMALNILQFGTAYQCEADFIPLAVVKLKYQPTLKNNEDDLAIPYNLKYLNKV